MKIKVGNTIYDSSLNMVMVILSDADKQNIANMDPDATMYCAYPDGSDRNLVNEFMKDE